MKKNALIVVAVILFSSCALEIANVIGPGGGYVFYDKGNYDGGWRYKQCSSFDFCEIPNLEPGNIAIAIDKCSENSGGWYTFHWEIPDEKDLKKMLECFSYGLTKFSPDYYYLAINKKETYNPKDPYNQAAWDDMVILHMNYNNKATGEAERVTLDQVNKNIRIRPIRRF